MKKMRRTLLLLSGGLVAVGLSGGCHHEDVHAEEAAVGLDVTQHEVVANHDMGQGVDLMARAGELKQANEGKQAQKVEENVKDDAGFKVKDEGMEVDAKYAVDNANAKECGMSGVREVMHTKSQWKKILTPEQYAVLREGKTARPYKDALYKNHQKGMYVCAGCGAELFSSDVKYDSGTGWPSFYDAKKGALEEQQDHDWLMVRTEVLCSKCGGHLGHVFTDGPKPTGLRYCINGPALKFVPSQ